MVRRHTPFPSTPTPSLSAVAALFVLAVAAAGFQDAPPDKGAPADDVYRTCLRRLSAGDQRDAEELLARASRTFKDDARLTFFAAACTRSRFDVAEAAPLFARAAKLDADDGPYGRASKLILALDRQEDVPANFVALRELVDAHADDPLLIWMAAVQCRSLARNEEGVEYFGRLLKQLDPGPVLVHQTYANLLDEVGRSADAMPHRELAVRLEPAPWAYQGMANILTRLGRWAEADAAYEKCIGMRPDVQYWINWAWSMERRGDDEGVIAKCEIGTRRYPDSPNMWIQWGDAERRLGRGTDAILRYERALEIKPNSAFTLRRAAEVLRELGENERAEAMEARLEEVTPKVVPPADASPSPPTK